MGMTDSQLHRQTRRPSRFSVPTLTLAVLTATTHTILAFTNCILVGAYKSSHLAATCQWSVDVAWTLRNHSCSDPRNHYTGYAVAAALRFLITLAIAAVWLASLATFWRSLAIVSIVDPHIEPNVEVREILARHSATLVRLAPPGAPVLAHPGADVERGEHRHHGHGHAVCSGGCGELPHMPDGRTGRGSEATQATFESSRTVEALGWLGRAVEWLVGPAVSKAWEEREMRKAGYGVAVDEEDVEDEDEAMEMAEARRAVDRPRLNGWTAASEQSEMGNIFPETKQPLVKRSLEPPTTGPPVAPSNATRHPNPAARPSRNRAQVNPFFSSHPRSPVYVRMSDGHLVRKLSTINSASHPATPGSNGSDGRTRDGSMATFHSCLSGGEGSAAADFGTMREVEWRHGMRWEMASGARLPRGVEGSEGEDVVIWDEEGSVWREGRLGRSVGGD